MAWWIKNRDRIKKEGALREEIHTLVEKREDPEQEFTAEDHKTLASKFEESDMDNTQEVIEAEICDDDDADADASDVSGDINEAGDNGKYAAVKVDPKN